MHLVCYLSSRGLLPYEDACFYCLRHEISLLCVMLLILTSDICFWHAFCFTFSIEACSKYSVHTSERQHWEWDLLSRFSTLDIFETVTWFVFVSAALFHAIVRTTLEIIATVNSINTFSNQFIPLNSLEGREEREGEQQTQK